MKQHTQRIAMVRPAAFGFNEETAADNHFQKQTDAHFKLQIAALKEFDEMVALLRKNGVDVLVLEDGPIPAKPDAIFPNNWFCCNKGMIQLFPMCASNRRLEKNGKFIDIIKEKTALTVVKDWGHYENKGFYLESTGSMIIDHVNNIAYACISARTNKILFEQFCKENHYLPVCFNATDVEGKEIYHTNVMMSVGEKLAVVCLSAIKDEPDKMKLVHELQTTGHEIVDISFDQMNNFAGNMLELLTDKYERIMVMSKTAFKSLNNQQVAVIEKYNRIITPEISTIENTGGGSVRCMMAELFY